ncbi:MAG TPA: dihydrodipicolinate synthase family protein [Puia sp.]|nr:dihydrodipicolinate synthase family protein [Puia sp.]
MNIFTAQDLRGNWGTLLLPVNPDDSIDYGRLGEELDHLTRAGLDGIYSNGTAGEFHNQTEEEFLRVQELMAEKCHRTGVPFQIGVSHPFPAVALERVRRTIDLQPSAFQVILPDWVTASPEEQTVFLQRIAAAAEGIPLVLYNPPHAKAVLRPQELARLSETVPSAIGVKTGAGDHQWYAEMRPYAKKLSVFVPGHLLATGVQEQVAAGAYSNVACLSPRGAQDWWRMMQTDLPEALRIQQRIGEFFDRCILPYKQAGYSNPALDKFLATVGRWGNVGTRLRWPYKWIDEKEAASARVIAKSLLPEFF